MCRFVIYMPDGEFNRISISELNDMDNVDIHYQPLSGKSNFTKRLFQIHKSVRINRIINLPFKEIWGRIVSNNHAFSKNKYDEIYFVFHYSYYYFREIGLFELLKNEYPNSKLVFWFRDKVALLQKHLKGQNKELDLIYLKTTFDLILVYNCLDANTFGFTYYDDFDSKIDLQKSTSYPSSDLFFAGTDKGRFDLLIQIYEKFKEHNLTCDFYITGVPQDKQVYKDDIVYADKWMPYIEMLQRSVDSRCILELTQEGAVGYTSRAIEAIMYNKKLLTNSEIVLESPIFSNKHVQFFREIKDIDCSFIRNDNEKNINFHYNGEFSPKRFLELIKENLHHHKKNGEL